MFDIEQLPNEIQLMIWTYAQKAAKSWGDDLNRLNDFTLSDRYGIHLYRIQQKATDYIIYMKRVKQYELGINKNKPWPHYLPQCRPCTNCGNRTILKTEPSWKRQCLDCFKHSKHPWIYGFR